MAERHRRRHLAGLRNTGWRMGAGSDEGHHPDSKRRVRHRCRTSCILQADNRLSVVRNVGDCVGDCILFTPPLLFSSLLSFFFSRLSSLFSFSFSFSFSSSEFLSVGMKLKDLLFTAGRSMKRTQNDRLRLRWTGVGWSPKSEAFLRQIWNNEGSGVVRDQAPEYPKRLSGEG